MTAEVTILGSSSGNPSADRSNAALVLDVGGEMYQFDAGEGVSAAILRAQIDHSHIRTVFLTHGHVDHFAGLFLEIQMMHLARRSGKLTKYMPEELVDPVKNMLLTGYMFPERLEFEIAFNAVKPDPVFRDDKIAVYSRANSHLRSYENEIKSGKYVNKMQSYSYVIKTDGTKIVYSGDIGSLEDYADLLSECDLLITEGLHLDLEELFALSADSSLKKLVLTHLSSEMYFDPDPIKALAIKYGVMDLIIAEDGLKIAI